MFNPTTDPPPLGGDPKQTSQPSGKVGGGFNHASDVPPCGKGGPEKAGGKRSDFNTTGLNSPPL